MRKAEHRIDACLALLETGRNVCFCSDAPDPPAPDPNIGLAAQSNAEVGKEALALSRQMYEENKPRQARMDDLAQQFVDSSVASQKLNDQYGRDYHDRMTNTFYPIEDALVTEATDAGGEADQERQAGLARSDAAQAASNNRKTMEIQAQSYGLNPNSGRFADMMTQRQVSDAAVEANAMNQARLTAKQLGWAKRMDASSLGRGLPSSQATSAGIALQSTNTGLNSAQAPISSAVGIQDAANRGFGTATSAFNSQGQLGLGAYQTATSGWGQQANAAAEKNGAILGMAGTIGGGMLGGGFGGAMGKYVFGK